METGWIWIIVMIIFLGIELFVPLLYFVSIATGCLFAALSEFSGIDTGYTVLIFTLTSLLALITIKVILRNSIKKDSEFPPGLEGMTQENKADLESVEKNIVVKSKV